ncbi:Apoptosis-antagonizing transcription factor, C-terminal [Phytophthora cactorum]|nr:Apoptosis-antagonizing transcription factor, C-terminal [Phytophthora cactorum]
MLFNIDEAEDFDDGTRAVVHSDAASDSEGETQSSTRLRSSRKQRLQAESKGSGKQREQASALRVKNWDAELMESEEYAGKVVKRKDLNDGIESPDEDAIAEWSDAEPFGASDDEEEEEEKVEEEESEEDNAHPWLQKEDSARLMGAQDSEKVVEKAKHVRNQKLIWERCLEPRAAVHETDGETTDEEIVAKTKEQVVAELYTSINAKRKRSCDELWQEITTSNRAMLPQYSDILNTYTRKTDLAAGSKNNQAKKFKAVNQDILAQVESRGSTDELMYDDSDFYQQLLKEFIESGGGGAGQDAMVRRTHRKKKKLVNRKASKGRQLRYTVHPKLENFMFPEPYPKSEMDVSELFRSLFGQVRQ